MMTRQHMQRFIQVSKVSGQIAFAMVFFTALAHAQMSDISKQPRKPRIKYSVHPKASPTPPPETEAAPEAVPTDDTPAVTTAPAPGASAPASAKLSPPAPIIPTTPAVPAAPRLIPSQQPTAYVTPARETSVDRLVVSLFKANVFIANPALFKDKTKPPIIRDNAIEKAWNDRRQEIQVALIALLNERSYLSAVPSLREYYLAEGKDIIAQEAKKDGVDGVLVGEFVGKTLEIAIRSGATGRTLVHLSVPIIDIRKETTRDVCASVVDNLVLSIPYRGFVVGANQNMVKLNLGRSDSIKVGTRLEIFELDGKKANFSSSTNRLGELKITQIGSNAAIGMVTQSDKPIPLFAKVALPKLREDPEVQLANRVHNKFFFYAGTEFNYIDTQVSSFTTSLQKRIYEVPISPGIGLGFGHSKVVVNAILMGLSNASNKVTLIQANASYQFLTKEKNKLSLLSSAGIYFANYSATNSVGGTAPLDSVTSYSGFFEERLHYVTSPHTKLFIAGNLYFPYFTSDADNGSSSPFGSGGIGGYMGIRLDLSRKWAAEGGLQTRFLGASMSGATGGNISEFQYGVFARLNYLL